MGKTDDTRKTHLKTLLWKNWLLKRRQWKSMLLEILFPLIFILLLSYLKYSTTTDEYTETGFTLYRVSDNLFKSGGNLKLPYANRGFNSDINKEFIATETSMSGLLLLLGQKSSVELRNTDTLTSNQQLYCQYSLGVFGKVGIAETSTAKVPDVCTSNILSYKLGIAPDNEFTRNYFYETMKLWYPSVEISNDTVKFTKRMTIPSFEDSVKFFKDAEALEKYIRDPEYGSTFSIPKIYAAIIFDEFPLENEIGKAVDVEYSIRMNATLGRRGVMGDVPRTLGDPAWEYPFRRTLENEIYPKYAVQGFMTLQTAVARFLNCMPDWDITTKSTTGICTNSLATAVKSTELDDQLFETLKRDMIIQSGMEFAFSTSFQDEFSNMDPIEKEKLLAPLRNAPQPILGSTVSPFPIAAFTSSPFYDAIRDVFALVFILAYLYTISRILVVLINEKETRTRELLKILGVQSNNITFCWYITYAIIFVISCILQAIAGKLGVFGNSDPLLIFIFFFLFSMSIMSYGYVVSTLFSRSRTGSFAGMGGFFALYFISSVYSAESTITAKAFGCLLPPVALTFGVQAIADAEATGLGMSFGNAGIVNNNFSMDIALYVLVIDIILYTLLGMYLERVVPQEFGTTKKWYFPITQTIDFIKNVSSPKIHDDLSKKDAKTEGQHASIDVLEIANIESIEPVGPDLHGQINKGQALVIANLQKQFQVPGGIKVAVKGVSLTLYKDQITCLLGHNGAGKTTLISMLTGMIPPSGGDAMFQGLSLVKDMGELRKSLGICFQHDVLYANLTVREHLLFYAMIKGYKDVELQDEVKLKIQEVGLTEKVNVKSSALSGGMKRKLSVAISLLGDSALVFLDEPTSGMDPYSRRSTWEILLNNRKDRVMVLTTHFMDEADILGDRIAILAEGQVKCCGSSLFLKNRYGAGYTFILVKNDSCVVEELISYITHIVPTAKVLSNIGAELQFQLPLDATKTFPELFESLEAKMESLGVLSYGISVTTLEEVFIKVAEADDETGQHTLSKSIVPEVHDKHEKHNMKDGTSNSGGVSQAWNPTERFLIHVEALLLKRFRNAKRDKKVLIFSSLLPIVLILLGLVVLNTSSIIVDDIRLPMNAVKYQLGEKSPTPYYCTDTSPTDWCTRTMQNYFVGSVPESLDPAGTSIITSKPFPDTTIPTVFGITYDKLNTEAKYSELLLRVSQEIHRRGYAIDATVGAKPAIGQRGAYMLMGDASQNILGYNILVNTTATHGAVVTKALIDQAIYRFMVNNGTASVSNQPTLKVNSYPFPLTSTTKALFSSFLSFTACLFIVIAFAYFPASIVVFLVKEKQNEHNAKHQQLVSGVSLPAFWVSNYIWDMFMYLWLYIASIILILAYDISVFTGTDCLSCTSSTFPSVMLIFLLFGFAICPFTYCLSYFFNEHASAQTYTVLLNYILGSVLVIVSFILDVLSPEDPNSDSISVGDVNRFLRYFYRLSPLYNLGTGLMNLTRQEMKANLGLLSLVNPPSPFDSTIMGWEIGYLVFDAIFYIVCALAMDYALSNPKLKGMLYPSPVSQVKALAVDDSDVAAEAKRVNNPDVKLDDVLQIKHLRKVYKGGKIAVHDLSFGLKKGECFGYLGINGAGKTTTMKMLTGDVLPSSGGGTLGGFDILSEQLQARRLIGYCPQFDALFELMSVREHLELFARIKGVSRANLNTVVSNLISEMNLSDFEHKLAGTLSGGNKRKLSVAIALIGSPQVIFLDEPSTGMDPVSRRFMWNVIAAISTKKKEATIILTTHNMEECEALCSKVGIMVGGRLQCLGSVQHLKHKFGKGLMVELKLQGPSDNDITARMQPLVEKFGSMVPKDKMPDVCEYLGNKDWSEKIHSKHPTGYALDNIIQEFGELRMWLIVAWWIAEERGEDFDNYFRDNFGTDNVKLLEQQNENYRYQLVSGQQKMQLSQVFSLMETGKEKYHVREYTVSQTTLEQIFNSFASKQGEEKGVARGVN